MVTVILPTKNEEQYIGETIDTVRRAVGGVRILVVDAHSRDRTVEIAREKGVEVIFDNGKGKGAALCMAFEHTKDDVVFVDPDATYPVERIGEFIRALEETDTVIGNRVSFSDGAIPGPLRLGDAFSRVLFRLLFGRPLDNLSGFRGLSRRAIELMRLESPGFGIETEITAKTARLALSVRNIPINYMPRRGKSKFDPVRDGLCVVLSMCRWRFRNLQPPDHTAR